MRWGAGAGASRLISGNMEPHRRLEERLAEFKGYEAALLFGSGYLANTGTIAALAGRGEVVFSDELNHASIIDGCRLSRAETFVYRHGDLEHLAWGLREAGGRGSLIVTDGVFSMDGDVAPLAELARAGPPPRLPADGRRGARHRGARAGRARLGRRRRAQRRGRRRRRHPRQGARLLRRLRLRQRARPVEYLLNTARPFIFSTAPPPPSVGAAASGAGAARVRAAAGRAPAAPTRATLRAALAAEGLGAGRSRDPDRPGRGRRRRRDDGALRAGARARRLRPGDPPADRSRGLLAPALHRDGHPPRRASCASGAARLGAAARELGLVAAQPLAADGPPMTEQAGTGRAGSSSPAPAPRSARPWSPPPSPAPSPPAASAVAVFKPAVTGLDEAGEADHELLRRAAGSRRATRRSPPTATGRPPRRTWRRRWPARRSSRERLLEAARGGRRRAPTSWSARGSAACSCRSRRGYLVRDLAVDLGCRW